MKFKGIELHNVRELIKGECGYVLSRIPLSLQESVSGNGKVASGCELRFVPISDEVKIKISRTNPGISEAIVYYGSIQSGWRELYKHITYGECEIVLKKSPAAEKLHELSEKIGAGFSPDVIRVVLQSAEYEIIDVSGECRPPLEAELPRKKYLAYGSSITHGSLSISPTRTYPFIISEQLRCDFCNFGFAGEAKLEPEMADYIAEKCDFDFATLEMGINMLKGFTPEELEARARYFIKRIAEAHPDKPIFVTDIFYHSSDMNGSPNPTTKSNIFRNVIKRVATELALPNVTHIEGLSLLNGAHFLSEDLTHPNASGIEEIARNLTARIRAKI